MASAIQSITAHIDNCYFKGATGGYALEQYTGYWGATLSNSTIEGCQVWTYSGTLLIEGCHFTSRLTSEVALILVEDAWRLTITGCVFDGVWEGAYITSRWGNDYWWNVQISNNLFYSGWINLGSGPIEGLVVSDNVLHGGGCDLLYNAGATARYVSDVMISGNLGAPIAQGTAVSVNFLGTALSLENVTVQGNEFYSSNPTTPGRAMIDLQSSRIEEDSGQGIRVVDNLLEFAGPGDFAIRLRGSVGSNYGHAVVANNMLRASGDGVLIENIRDVVVSNNVQGRASDNPVWNDDSAHQLVVTGAKSVVVDGNKWFAGEKGDNAGTGAAIYVEGVSGAVRNNDIWGKLVGAMNTALKYSAGLVESGNVYHGLHSSQTGSVLTNGIVGQASGSGGTASVVFTGTATGAVV